MKLACWIKGHDLDNGLLHGEQLLCARCGAAYDAHTLAAVNVELERRGNPRLTERTLPDEAAFKR